MRTTQHQHRLPGLNQLAGLGQSFENNAIDGRIDARKTRVEAHGIEVRSSDVVSRAQILHLFLGGDFVGAQTFGTLQVAPCFLDCLGLRH